MQMNVSLDGAADHRVAFADDELHDFASHQLDNLDIALFGRVTYQLMESYWPHAPSGPQASKSVIEFAKKFNSMPKIVFSQTLKKAEWDNTKLVRENVADEILRLKEQSGKNISIGGISISKALIKHGLIYEYLLLIQPVI